MTQLKSTELQLVSNQLNQTNMMLQLEIPVQEEIFNLHTPDGMRLHVHSWRGTGQLNKVVVIVHGLGGHSHYYADSLAPYLAPSGAITYAPDLRGHGRSEGRRGDIESFEEFQQDVETVVRWARQQHPDLPLFLLGESMGTSISIVYAACAPKEVRPDGLLLVACVVAPTIKPRADEIFRTIWYMSRNRQKIALPITGREEEGVRDLDFVQVLKSDRLFNRHISVRFLTNMTSNMNRAAKLHSSLKMPVLLLQGQHDITVRHRATRAFFKRIAATDKEMHVIPEAYHAVLNDPASPQARQYILNWLDRQTKTFSSTK